MPEEPNRPIEELLLGYSRHRGKIAPQELHGATRKMLQGEVERVYGTQGVPKQSWTSLFRRFWPQFAFGLSLFIILIGLLLPSRAPRRTIVKDSNQQQKSKQSPLPLVGKPSPEAPSQPAPLVHNTLSAPEASEAPVPLAAQRPSEAKSLKRERTDALATTQDSMAQNSEARGFNVFANAPAPRMESSEITTAQAEATQTQSATRFQRDKAKVEAAPATLSASETTSVPSLAKVAAPRSVTTVNALTNLGDALRTTFVATTNDVPGLALTTTASPVLTHFNFEQLGEKLRITDEDGSIYSGVIQATPSPPTNIVALLDNAAVYPFQAHGTNLTFGEAVTIFGQLFQRTNTLPSPEDTFAFRTRTNAPPGAESKLRKPAPMIMRAILGRAILGQTNEFQIKAFTQEP
jgi:hypothetical protein